MVKIITEKVVKKILLLSLATLICFVSVGCNKTKTDKVEVKQEEEIATQEPCVFINEWDRSVFQVFGFEALVVPENSFYHTIEKGRTYVKAEFSTDQLDDFLEFFSSIYRVMWGTITDPLQVLEKKDNIYYFEVEYAVPQIYKEALENGVSALDRPEKNAFLKVQYSEEDKKCVLECKLIDKGKENKKNKEQQDKKNNEEE